MFLNLRGVIYNVDDLEKAKEWYGKVLDMAPVTDGVPFPSFIIGSNRIGLNLVDHPPGDNDSGAVAYWAVSDIEAEYKRLLELGAVARDGIRDMGGGLHMATVKDPFGNVIGIGGMSGVPDNTAIEEKPSRTALWTTHMRAFSTREENEEIRGRDYLAEIFLPEDQSASLRDMEKRQEVKEKYFAAGVYEYIIARTRIFDRFFKRALEEDFEQVVFLGAGYDSRPYRFREQIGAMPIFELDIPPTQEHKKRCLAGAGVEIPDQLTYVPINFNTQSIKDVLFSAGFDESKKTLFMWEGVTYYLAPEAVDAALEFVRSNSPAGSAIAFDYTAMWPGVFDAYGMKELIEFGMKNFSGEFGSFFNLEEGAIEPFLLERGFEISDHQNPGELEKSFLTLKDGGLFGHITGHFRIVQAMTTG